MARLRTSLALSAHEPACSRRWNPLSAYRWIASGAVPGFPQINKLWMRLLEARDAGQIDSAAGSIWPAAAPRSVARLVLRSRNSCWSPITVRNGAHIAPAWRESSRFKLAYLRSVARAIVHRISGAAVQGIEAAGTGRVRRWLGRVAALAASTSSARSCLRPR